VVSRTQKPFRVRPTQGHVGCRMATRKPDKGFYYYLDLIERTARKYEADIIATGRFKYDRTEGYRKIYVELTTGKEVSVLMPFNSNM
jgi:hypothetical protein